MPKKLLIVLGNGFSYDFVENNCKGIDIDVGNLFKFGAHVPWPATNEPGFLSVKRCPNLWHLGARPTMTKDEALLLIEDIITCVNVYAMATTEHRQAISEGPNKIYIQAYRELVRYLRHLFVYYNDLVEMPVDVLGEWRWSKFFKAASQNHDIAQVDIITFNYDIWLERTLMASDIPFSVHGTPTAGAKFTLFKPHGSISFCHREKLDRAAFQISKGSDLISGKLSDYEVRYQNMDEAFVSEPIIPPAGDAIRIEHQPETWAADIRKAASEKAGALNKDDRLIIAGLSYWHVDRAELDLLLVNAPRELDVTMINPNPARTMNAVLTSLFSNYVFMPTTDKIVELAK